MPEERLGYVYNFSRIITLCCRYEINEAVTKPLFSDLSSNKLDEHDVMRGLYEPENT